MESALMGLAACACLVRALASNQLLEGHGVLGFIYKLVLAWAATRSCVWQLQLGSIPGYT